MADKSSKWPQNADGKFYVDETCISCDACIVAAPDNFFIHEDGHAYVKKQPETPEEILACNEAMESCPVEAIGNDGSGDEASKEDDHDGVASEQVGAGSPQ